MLQYSLVQVLLPCLVDLPGWSENPTTEKCPSLRIPAKVKFGLKELMF